MQNKKLWFYQSMRGKLVLWFLALSLIPLLVAGGLAYYQAQTALTKAAFDRLEAIRTIKKNQLEDYLNKVQQDETALADNVSTMRQQAFNQLNAVIELKRAQIKDLVKSWHDGVLDRASDVVIINGLTDLSTAFATVGGAQVRSLDLTKDNSAYGLAYRSLAKDTHDDLNIRAYEDVLLINQAGEVVFSAKQKEIFGANLTAESYKNSNLAQLYQQLKTATIEQTYIADAAMFGGSISMFVGAPVYSGTTHIGTLAYQIPFAEINTIMKERIGLGQTDESFLVGPDKRLRSDTFLDPVNRTVVASFAGSIEKNGVDTVASRAALAGKSGVDVLHDYRGKYAIVNYQPLNVSGLNWIIITKQDVVEIFTTRAEGETENFFSLFAKNKGYHDLMLLTRDGYAFYTIAQEADYKTNFLTGPYKGTHLGQLIQHVASTGQNGLTDYAPYPPSDNKPMAFVVAPSSYQGQLEFMVVLQLPLEKINAIMHERTGMGETGETILVGADHRIRSDAYLDPIGHSVEASFAGTVEKNGINAETVQESLKGNSGTALYTNYLGVPGVGAYAPFTFGGLHWAIVAKQDQSEAFAAVYDLMGILLTVVGVAAFMVIILALWIASSLARPIMKLAEIVRVVAEGNLNVRAEINSSDETAVLAADFNQMIANLRELIGQVSKNAGRVAGASQQLASASGQAAQAGQQVAKTIQQVAEGTNQQTSSVTEATGNIEQISRAAEGIARGSQEQAQAVQKTSMLINETSNIVKQVGQVASLVTTANSKVTEAARHGVVSVEQTSQGMATIRARAIITSEKVKEMNKRAKEIGHIVDTIDNIADKTDMLALNAAVEAARAGEYGRGFAVVADQVRKLSEDSKVATREIDELIERVQDTVNEAVAAMESTTIEVDNGTRLTKDTTQSLQQILQLAEEAATSTHKINESVTQLGQKSDGVVTAIEAMSAVVEENTAVAEEMAANSQEVTTTMEGVASIAEENSAAAEQVSASAEEMLAQVEEVTASSQELANLADQLKAAVAKFKVS